MTTIDPDFRLMLEAQAKAIQSRSSQDDRRFHHFSHNERYWARAQIDEAAPVERADINRGVGECAVDGIK